MENIIQHVDVRLASSASILAAMLALSTFTAAATQPCSGFEYSVSYSTPIWAVKMIYDQKWPLASVWFMGHYTNETNTSLYESMLNHTGRIPTDTDRVTVMDLDSDLNLSNGDEVLFWEENASHESQRYRGFPVFFGNPDTGFGMTVGFGLQDGLVAKCPTSGPDLTIGVAIFLAVLVLAGAVVALLVRFSFLRKRKR